MLSNICSQEKCTACGACINICPRDCIKYVFDEYGVKRAYKDEERCIDCNLCLKTCPSISTEKMGRVPVKCYAAWSNDCGIRFNSASGGIASEFYKYATENGYWIVGVSLNENFDAVYSLKKGDWEAFQNSKYTYSDTGYIYRSILEKLYDNEKVLFIGLPCHVAALKLFLYTKNVDLCNLVTIDLICHGVTPQDYLKEHVRKIETQKGKKATEVYFRDPKYKTYTFTFSLKNCGTTFYKRKVNRNDAYQIAYHRGIGYRENCYLCKFASIERQGDITLSDFVGVGSKTLCDYTHRNVSCVMINSEKGETFYKKLVSSGRIFSEERPIEEEYNTERMLHNPTPVPPERLKFLNSYRESGDFDKALICAAQKIIIFNEVNNFIKFNEIRLFVLKRVPKSLKERIKRVLRKCETA